jgi:ribosomal protein L40E
MPSNRPNLILDEQAFQDLLSAAFTIQEHSSRRWSNPPIDPTPGPATVEPETKAVCQHCGAEKALETSACTNCGIGEFRPGERLQRNWASMWLMSQEQGLWPERARSQESPLDSKKGRTQSAEPSTSTMHPPEAPALTISSPPYTAVPVSPAPGTEANPQPGLFDTLQFDSLTAQHAGRVLPALASSVPNVTTFDVAGRQSAPDALSEETDQPSSRLDDGQLGNGGISHEKAGLPEVEVSSPKADTSEGRWTDFALEPKYSAADHSALTLQASADDEFLLDPDQDTNDEAQEDVQSENPVTQGSLLAEIRAILVERRADVYLGIAILVAAVALVWPAVSSPQPAQLGVFEKAMVMLGIAEAPAPVAAHLPGDPGVEVWVDPHTALYYCPGEDQYGKTPNGRFTSQREAQMDRFEPASRSACE